jgi:hypothetical protein
LEQCVSYQVLQLARLIAAERETGQIVALDVDPRPAELCGEPSRELQRGGQGCQTIARMTRDQCSFPFLLIGQSYGRIVAQAGIDATACLLHYSAGPRGACARA